MQIKKLIWDLLPYGIYKELMKRHNSNFFEKYVHYINSKKSSEFIGNERGATYSSIVSVEGLGYSGSGAVLDLLCEIDDCEVLGTDVKAKTLGTDHKAKYELDLLRLAGGLFEIERFLSSSNIYQNDALLNRLASFFSSFYLFNEDEKIKDLCFAFFDSLTELSIFGAALNTHLPKAIDQNAICYLRPMSIREYHELCSSFLRCLFNHLNHNNKPILVTDQLLCDQDFNVAKYREYIPECKNIVVYRDPRDVYAFAVQNNVKWIAHSDVYHFIKWFEIMVRGVNLQSPDYLVVEFERLLTSYDEEVIRILNYLEINEKCHNKTKKKRIFNPAISIKNVGIWKTSSRPISDFDLINEAFRSFCFNG